MYFWPDIQAYIKSLSCEVFVLIHVRGYLRYTWALLGPTWVHLGPTLAHSGPTLALLAPYLGPPLGTKSEMCSYELYMYYS